MCFTVTFVLAGRDAFEVDNAEVQPLLQPDAVHDADHLKSQHVLPQVLSNLTRKQTNRETNYTNALHFRYYWLDFTSATRGRSVQMRSM